MRYMVMEEFVADAPTIYERVASEGRRLPSGLEYVDSWVSERLDRCFQLMETDDPALFEEWISAWSDLARFEVVPVIDSAEAATRAHGAQQPPD